MMKLVNPAYNDGRFIARGTCIWPGNTISYSEAKVFDDNERLIAHGTSTLMVLIGKRTEDEC